jgi:hypothetical protein
MLAAVRRANMVLLASAVAVALFVEAVTEIVNGPAPTVLTMPVVSIRATVVSLLVHISRAPEIIPPVADEAVAVTVAESPAGIVSAVTLIVTDATDELTED